MRRRQRPVSEVRESAMELETPVEWSLVFWKGLGIPGLGCDSPEDLAAAWFTHRDRILPHFTKQCPGLRPFAMFALGEVELPPRIEKPYPNDVPFMSSVGAIYEERVYGGYQTISQHLEKIGVLTKNEIEASQRFYKENPLRSPFKDYTMLTETS